MNIFDSTAVTYYTLPGGYLGSPFDVSFLVCYITNPTWKVRKVETTTFTTDTEITLTDNVWITPIAIDGDTAWITLNVGASLLRPEFDIACFDFTAGLITYRWQFPYRYGAIPVATPRGKEILKAVYSGNLYFIGDDFAGQVWLKKFSFAGSELASTNIGSAYQFFNVTSWIFQNGAFWCINKTKVGGVYKIYKVTTGGTLTSIDSDFDTFSVVPKDIIRNSDDTKLLIYSATVTQSDGCWGTLDTGADTWTMENTHLEGTPHRRTYGGIGLPRIDYDANNFIGVASTANGMVIPIRTHKVYGTQDTHTYWPNGLGAGGTILPYSGGKFLTVAGTALSVVDWTDDSANTITPTTNWQETALQTLTMVGNFGSLGTTMHNFYFSATKGDLITFTLDSAKDPAAECNINVNVRMYISVHELWEERLANNVPVAYANSDKTLFFAAPATGNYLVRVGELNGISTPYTLYSGTFKLGYALMVPSFTHDPDPQVPLSPVNFTDTSSGGPTVWHWDFGDGGTSSLQNPTHSFATSDVYNVTLTLKG